MAKPVTAQVDSKVPWAESWAYVRAVRRGSVLEGTGTTAVGTDGFVIAEGDAYGQTKQALDTIDAAIIDLGGWIENVALARRQPKRHRAVGFVEAKRTTRCSRHPASTWLGRQELLLPEIQVEVETLAVIDDSDEAGMGA